MQSSRILLKYLTDRGYCARIKKIPKSSDKDCIIVTDTASNNSSIVRMSIGTTSLVSRIASDKSATYEVADMIGVHYPRSAVFSSDTDFNLVLDNPVVKDFLRKSKPLVVKPLDSQRSKGVSLNFTGEEQLKKAIDKATAESDHYIIQEFVDGEELRITCIEGKAVSVLLRQRPFVVGDGASSIRQLIRQENIDRQKITSSLASYPQLTDSLIDSAVPQDMILPKGEKQILSQATMIKTGASVYEISDDIHPSFITVAEKIANFLPGGTISVDIITPNYTLPANDENYSLIEINTGASLVLYYSCRDGKHKDIVGEIIGPSIIEDLAKKSIHPTSK